MGQHRSRLAPASKLGAQHSVTNIKALQREAVWHGVPPNGEACCQSTGNASAKAHRQAASHTHLHQRDWCMGSCCKQRPAATVYHDLQ